MLHTHSSPSESTQSTSHILVVQSLVSQHKCSECSPQHQPCSDTTNRLWPWFPLPPQPCKPRHKQKCPSIYQTARKMQWLWRSDLMYFFSTNPYLVVVRGHFWSWTSAVGLFFMRGRLCPLQGHRALRAPCDQARVCHCAGSLAIRRALNAAPSCTLAKLLSGKRNSSLLTGCRRLRRVVPSWCSFCFSSPLLGASPCPARVQSLAAQLQGQ